MADRTHEVEDELTGPATQEGRVESVGGGPRGEDREDPTGEGQGRGVSRREEGRSPDAFVSTEVNDRTSQPGRDSKTRS